jgi:predicted TIM-barrel fold metal-dependent hydrolase
MTIRHEPLAFHMPPGACDCHTHVFGPLARYPLDPHRVYTPGDAVTQDLMAHQQGLGLQRVVVVQPSPYGADNRCTVDAIRAIGTQARAVAVIDEKTSSDELRDLHEAGVRGIRVNLETGGIRDTAYAQQQLQWAFNTIAPWGWHVQMFTNLTVLASLKLLITRSGIPVVVDHFCRAQADLGTGQAYLDDLLELVGQGHVWVKLSAPHRISVAPDGEAVQSLARALIQANPDRMLWGSDWPHPGGQPGEARSIDRIEAFSPVDDGRALNRLARWCRDDGTLHKILVHNPARLYGFQT